MPTNRKYGWRPDTPDFRDKICKMVLRTELLPPKISLLEQCPSVFNQGSIGSCVGNGTATCHHFEQKKQGFQDEFVPSRLFIYFNARELEGTINEDAGCMIRDAIKSLVKQGVCPESMWPYYDDSSTFKKRPPVSCYDNAIYHQVISYERVIPTENNIKSVLASGHPIVCGISLYESFESRTVSETGIVPMPSQRERLIGGHCVTVIGYDDSTRKFLMRNSWGSGWGNNGNFFLDYDYLTNSNLADDFWVIKMVEDEDFGSTTTTTTTLSKPRRPIIDWIKKIFGI